jgi:hypothetical protein
MVLGFGIVVVVVVLGILVAIAVWKTHRAAAEAAGTGHQVLEPVESQLRYRVPTGQDPVVLIAELGREGYEAVPLFEGGHNYVVVSCEDPEVERPRVRRIITEVSKTSPEGNEFDPDGVLFEDESRGKRVRREEGLA